MCALDAAEKIGRLPLYSLCAIVGVGLGCLYLELRARRLHIDAGNLEQAFLWGGIGCLLGAKLLSLLTQLPALAGDIAFIRTQPAAFMQKYVYAGFVFYGGLYGGLLGGWLCLRKRGQSLAGAGPALIPAIPLIHAFGRLGCLCTGCCFGVPAPKGVCGVVYTHSAIAPCGVALLPVQLYEAGIEGALFVLLDRQSRRAFRPGIFARRQLAGFLGTTEHFAVDLAADSCMSAGIPPYIAQRTLPMKRAPVHKKKQVSSAGSSGRIPAFLCVEKGLRSRQILRGPAQRPGGRNAAPTDRFSAARSRADPGALPTHDHRRPTACGVTASRCFQRCSRSR